MEQIPQSLLEASRAGRLIPFVGAGVSAAVRSRRSGEPLFPTWHRLLLSCADKLQAENKEDEAEWIRRSLRLRDFDLIDIATRARRELRHGWREFLREQLDPERDGIADRSLDLARRVWELSPLVITTNYDRVLRWAAPPNTEVLDIGTPAELADLVAGKIRRSTLWHLHGTISKPSRLILTADGYRHLYPENGNGQAKFEAALTSLRIILASKSILFIGFSLQDRYIGAQLSDLDRIFERAAGPHFVLLREAELDGFRPPSEVEVVTFSDFGEPLERTLRAIAAARSAAKRPPPLTRETAEEPEPPPPSSPDAHLRAPRFGEALHRTRLLARLAGQAGAKPVVAVEGLAGSGKTFLVADQVTTWQQEGRYRQVYWHDPQDNETLDDLLNAISGIGVQGASAEARCKSLVGILEDRDSLLVVDDFHKLDERSVKRLLNAATELTQAPNARVLVISRTYTDAVRSTQNVGHVRVHGFGRDETRQYLERRGFRHPGPGLISRLCEVTNGLPVALALFATLVLEFDRDPESLLEDEMVQSVRLDEWFQEILALIGDDAADLLRTLGLCEGPFNSGVVKLAGSLVSLTEPLRVFEYLQRCYLVQKYSPYRWSLHALVASMAVARMPEERRREIDLALGEHFAQGKVRRPATILSEEAFSWLVRACTHFQRAGAIARSDQILHSIAKTAKVRGHYESYIRIARNRAGAPRAGDRWVRYHVAHCLHLLGRFQESLDDTEELVSEASALPAWNQLINFQRLHAETMASLGMEEEALRSLRELLRGLPRNKIKSESLHHALSTEAWLLTLLGRYPEAARKAASCVRNSRRRRDWLGEAINLVRLATAEIGLGELDSAEELLDQALAKFNKRNLRRASAWALYQRAVCQLRKGDPGRALRTLERALDIAEDLGEFSRDYFHALVEMAAQPEIVHRLPRLSDALRRLSEVYAAVDRATPPSLRS